MSRNVTRILCCLFVLALACGTLMAQGPRIAPGSHNNSAVVPYVERFGSNATATIFSNLGPNNSDLYNDAVGGYYVTGPNAIDNPVDQWIGIPFTPKANSHATQLQAALGYISGTKRAVLALYTDNGGTAGTLIVQAETSAIPANGTCCQLAQVAITPTALTAGTQYWLVASSDDNRAPDFEAAWQPSNSANIAGDVGQAGWFTFSGLVPAGAVKGTIP
ncbi:MAG TPA: choice-of-anchor R domain-containing protein [Terriglobales bacterium]|nr:choice-of-anchor R domain-containing protein [Terriglobales bacterium]